MKPRSMILLLVLAAMAAFATQNWAEFMRPTSLSLLFATVQAPLGLIMLLLSVVLLALFLVYVVSLQTSLMFDARRQTRELQAQRQLADRAEASRLTELHDFLAAELPKLAAQCAGAASATAARLDDLEQKLSANIEQTGSTLAAYIGELEDRLERLPGGAAGGA